MTSPPFGFFLCHVEIMARGTHDNDNEPLSFISLAAVTANVVRYLETDKQKDEQSKSDPAPSRGDDEKRAQELEYVEHRLRELRSWERKISGRE
jgi:hypothetical protein